MFEGVVEEDDFFLLSCGRKKRRHMLYLKHESQELA